MQNIDMYIFLSGIMPIKRDTGLHILIFLNLFINTRLAVCIAAFAD